MATQKAADAVLLVRYSRWSLYFALALLLALGAYAVLIHVYPDSAAAAMAHRLAILLPVPMVIALAALRSTLHGVRAHPREAAMKAVLNDELRTQSLNRAYRNGLVAVLVVQPLLVFVLSSQTLSFPLLAMACATLLIGVATVLCSLLAYDR